LSEPEAQYLSAYSAGVNRFIEHCGKKLPWEFRLLRYEPEPWTADDTLTINKGLSFLLSTALYTRLNFLAVAARLENQPEKLRALMPTYPDDAATVVAAAWNPLRSLWEFTSAGLADSAVHPAGHGSNGWVVAPHRSTTGGALLANDPHLRMNLPSIWYLMHLRANEGRAGVPPYEVWGATIPGIPFVQIGRNRRIAWGITAAVCDDVEIYREKLHAPGSDRYWHAQEWRRMSRRSERITVRGKKAIEKIVRSTQRGPVISDFGVLSGAQEAMSARWTAQEPSREIGALYTLNRAGGWSEFLAALSGHSAPSLNFLYADMDGNIGYALAGKIPIRNSVPTLLPQEGWDDQKQWRGFVPWAEMPRLLNPPGGVIASANHKIVDSAYPYYLSLFFEPPHRAARIEELLASRDRHSVESMAEIQLDAVSLHARALVELLYDDLSSVDGDEGLAGAAVEHLRYWNGDCSVSSIAAAIFHVFHHRLLRNLLVPTLGEDLFAAYVEILNQCIVPTDAILRDENSPWFRGRSRRKVVFLSLKEACFELSRKFGANPDHWRWGEVHQLLMSHPLGRIAPLQPLLAIGPMASPGDGTTINLGFYRHSNPYRQSVGASLRFTADLSDPAASDFVLPSGQSGHPLSPYYGDQSSLWSQGRRIRLLHFDSATPVTRLILKPG
jgi:penicillin G amidase